MQAKTGTGKTLAFLIPACHKALGLSADQRRGKTTVRVVSPTRELCQQIYEEGRIRCTHVPLALQCVYGGDKKVSSDLAKFRAGCVVVCRWYACRGVGGGVCALRVCAHVCAHVCACFECRLFYLMCVRVCVRCVASSLIVRACAGIPTCSSPHRGG